MNQREKNKNIIAQFFDGKKSTLELADIVKNFIGFPISERTVERYEQELRRENKIGTRLHSDGTIDKTKQNIEFIYTLKNLLVKSKSIEPTKTQINKKGDTLNILISDWHIGRIIKNEYGEVIYNVGVAKYQVERFIKEVLTLLDNYISKGTPISNVNILSSGDICDGMGIFSTQETVSEFAPPFQVFEAIRLIQGLVLALIKRGLSICFYGVKGNHGEIRVHGKSQDTNANWDLMLYLVLDFWAKEVLKNKKLRVIYSELDYLNFNNRGWIYHIRHIAPSQSETAAGKAKFLGWVKKHNCNLVAYGHLHHYGIWDRSGITVIRGGALTVADEFAESLAEESEPIQVIWGCNEKRPVTFIYPVDLGIRKKQN